ncbi:MAG: CHASE domain-containing protein [Alphaproteobacteria bacterium]|nr:CHASE domain-containing protein [Alphaproteobacteria bacterium]
MTEKIRENYILSTLALVFVIFLTGQASLLFAIPPGYAAPLWPPAGISLFALARGGWRYLPAVFLGSFLINYSVRLDYPTDIQLLAPAGIALGASAQAALGAFLIKRLLLIPSGYEHVRILFLLLFLGGPVSCVLNAFLAPSVLLALDQISFDDYSYNVLTWWIGDTLGVLIFTPFMLLCAANNQRKISFKRKAIVCSTLFFLLLVTVGLFKIIFSYESSQKEQYLNSLLDRKAVQIHDEFELYMNTLIALERFINSSDEVTSQDFESFTVKFLEEHSSIKALAWYPRVLHQDRDQFENYIQDQGYESFEIKERIAKGELMRAREQDEYFPIAYIAPYDTNEIALGLNVDGPDGYLGKTLTSVLDKAKETKKPQATAALPLVQNENELGLIIYSPVFDDRYVNRDISDPALRGFVAIVFLVNEVFSDIDIGLPIHAELLITEDYDGGKVLFGSDRVTKLYKDNALDRKYHMLFKTVQEAGSGLNIYLLYDKAQLSLSYGNVWLFMVIAVTFTFLVTMLVFFATGRAEAVESLVEERTSKLETANNQLEEFSYRTSHDLRAPVVSCLGLVDVIEMAIQQGNKKQISESMEYMRETLAKLEQLIVDILNLSKVNHLDERAHEVDIEKLVKNAVDKFTHMEGFKDISFETDLQVKKITTLETRLITIFENLITNAIKYKDPEQEVNIIKIATREEDGDLVISIQDNGIGFPKETEADMFKMFKRFHSDIAYGSGLGLYTVKKSVDMLDGEIIYQKSSGLTEFKITLPMSFTGTSEA